MQFEGFSIHAVPHIMNAYCKCGESLNQVSNGWISKVMYCSKCENIYELVLRKIPNKKVTEKFLIQCREKIKKAK